MPSGIDRPHLGMTMGVMRGHQWRASGQRALDRRVDLRRAGDVQVLEHRRERHRRVRRRDHLDRALAARRRPAAPPAPRCRWRCCSAGWPRRPRPAGRSSRRSRGSCPCPAARRAQVDDLALDALLGQRRGRLERTVHHPAEGDDRDVACPRARRWPRRTGSCSCLRHLALEVVQDLVLAEDHRVVVADRLDQQALGVVRRARAHHLQARDVGEERVQHCECCAAARKPAPYIVRMTTGVSALPPNM